MYKKVTTDLSFVPREEETLQFWKAKDIFKKSIEQSAGKPTFTFYDGPPTANGKPHIGHILTRCIKDLIPRYFTMKGYNVLRKAGWDTHGLPVELEVEKLLGLDGKKQIEEYGVEEFIAECKKSVWKYTTEWERMSERVGFWVDMEHPYITYEDSYIESEWWALKKIHEQGLLYKGHKIVPYCPRCGTALSSHEVAQGYQEVKEKSVFVKFRCLDEDAHYLAWTTTPWTLPSNAGLCVNPDEEYVKVEADDGVIIMAGALVESVIGEDARILDRFKGKTLEHRPYEPLFDFTANHAQGKKGWFVTCDSYVTLNDGTGIVHTAPAFGEDDARVGREYDMPFIQLVNDRGELTGGTPWDGMFVKEADPRIIESLKASGKLFAEMDYEHNYPFCWRCDTPLLYYARPTWFIQMTAVRDKLMKFNRSVNWLPENIKEGRMGNFIENVIDWGISRERYWGTPLPVWICKDCNHMHVVGSRDELCEMSREGDPNVELHKPFIDRVLLNCPQCSGEMERVPEVIDCWFDSGAMPFAQWHYPFENQDIFKERYPANFISEAIDQTRGWFYTLLAISTLLFDEAAFQNCLVLGHVQDEQGRKMSKHIGNVIDPWTVLDAQGADAVRWYFYSSSAPWLPSRFGADSVNEVQRKFMGTLWNTYAFYILYAEIDQFNPTTHALHRDNLSQMDRWVLSRLHSTVKTVDAEMQEYHVTEAARALQSFVDELSNWYVRRGRSRYWGKEMTDDKEAAYMTLYTVLETLSRLCAPFIPFMSEQMYQNMVCGVDAAAPESVHLCDFPVADESYIDASLEENMKQVLDIVSLGRACRESANLKIRQPLATMYVQADKLDAEYAQIIAQELNVKKVEFTDDTSAFTTYAIKPQLRTMGPKYGKLIGKIGEALKTVDGNAVMAAFAEGKAFTFSVDGQEIEMHEADALSELTQKPGFVAQAEGGLTVVLDSNLTEALIEEGFVREIISKVQTMRKEAGFEVTDHIALRYDGNARIADLMQKFHATIQGDTLADVVEAGKGGYEKDWNINGENVTLSVEKR